MIVLDPIILVSILCFISFELGIRYGGRRD